MNFKCKSLLSFFFAIVFVAPVISNADDGNITIGGIIATAGCVSTSTSTVVSFGNIVISGGTATPGSQIAIAPAVIQVTGCPDNMSFTIIVEGDADDNDKSLFKIASGTGKSEGVAYKISVRKGGITEVLTPSSSSVATFTPTGSLSYASITLTVAPIVTLSNITSGSIDTTLTYTLLYQ